MTRYKIDTNYLFYIFITSHLIIWTLIPTLTNHNLPLDTIEALAWGSNLDWGFNKHPPMSAFLVEFFYQIFADLLRLNQLEINLLNWQNLLFFLLFCMLL